MPTVEITPRRRPRNRAYTEGDWVYHREPVGQAARWSRNITPIVKEDVISCDHGWWYPEDKDKELYSVWKSNINELMPHKEIGKLGLGSHYGAPYPARSIVTEG